MVNFHDLQEKIRNTFHKKSSTAYDDYEQEGTPENQFSEPREIPTAAPTDTDSDTEFADWDDDEIEMPEDEESEVEKAQILKKRYILMAAGSIIFIAVAAMAYSSMTPSTPDTKDTSPSEHIASNTTNRNLPSTYSDIAKYQKTKESPGSSEKQLSQGAATQPGQTTYHPPSGSGSSRAVSYSSPSSSAAKSSYTSTAPQATPVTAVSPSTNVSHSTPTVSTAEKEESEAMNSSIAFKIAKAVTQAVTGTGTAQAAAPVATHDITVTATSDMDSAIANSYVLQAGSVIQATLLTGITSDSPNGDVVAQVRQNIYDSQTGEHLLIPQGSRLIGSYGKAGNRGNQRIGVIFKRIILPDGGSIDLPDQQAIDGTGMQGLADSYTQHSSTLFRTAFMTALFAAGAQSATGNSSGYDNRSPGQEAVAGAVSKILDTADKLLDRDANIEPTITISPGFAFSVFINQDLSIRAYE